MSFLAAITMLLVTQGDQPARADLLVGVATAKAGEPFLAAVRLRMQPKWHVYWSNPGDSGTPTTVEWKLPAGWKATPIHYPTPRRFEDQGLVTYGYEGEVLLVSRITPPANAKAGAHQIRASVDWLACKESCIPGSAALTSKVSLGPTAKPSSEGKRLTSTMEGLPRKAPWSLSWTPTAQGYVGTLDLKSSGWLSKGTPLFVPFEGDAIDHAAPQNIRAAGNRVTLELKKSEFGSAKKKLGGLLISSSGERWPGGGDAYVVEGPVSAPSRTH